jgi:hypothetical protein
MLASEACDLVRYIEDREGKPFASAFLEKKMTEFFLYSGFLESKGILKSSYDVNQQHNAAVWAEKADAAGCAEVIRKAETLGCAFMAVHSRAIAKMDERGRAIVAEFWHARGLFPSVNDGIRFLRDPNRTYQNCKGRVFPWPTGFVVSRFWPALENRIGARRKVEVRNKI